MNKRIRGYLKKINQLLVTKQTKEEWEKAVEDHLVQIEFFQHERLIHLLVTLTFAILTVATFLVIVVTGYFYLILLFAAFLVLLVPYVWHYFVLENGVQEMYRQYDAMKATIASFENLATDSESAVI